MRHYLQRAGARLLPYSINMLLSVSTALIVGAFLSCSLLLFSLPGKIDVCEHINMLLFVGAGLCLWVSSCSTVCRLLSLTMCQVSVQLELQAHQNAGV